MYSRNSYFNQPITGYVFGDVATADTANGVGWAFSMIGKKVGNGSSIDFVKMHLAISGAMAGDLNKDGNYIWGAIPNGVRQGDVVQFEHCWFRLTSDSYLIFNRHTAIIASANGNVLQLLHQDAPMGGPVKLEMLNLNWKISGTYRFWRPVRW